MSSNNTAASNKITTFLIDLFGIRKPGFRKNLRLVLVSIFFMGFTLSFLLEVDLGQDPLSFTNEAISERIGWQFGNWQLLLNFILFVLVIVFSKIRYIGIGTLANMILLGYISDFFRFVWKHTIPAHLFTDPLPRTIFFVAALVVFIFSAALYMNADMGMSPYDALPFIIQSHLPKIPFQVVRIVYDVITVTVGLLVGGSVPIGTIILTFTLGPAISFVGKHMRRS